MTDSRELLLAPGPYAPADGFRLPLAWSRERAAELRRRVDPEGRTGILLLDPWNIVTFTGLWALTTERLLAAYLPPDGSAPTWFYPWLDHELVTTWWYGDGDCYFDVPDVPGQFPPHGTATAGPGQDRWEWLFERLRHRGLRPATGAIDGFVVDAELPMAAREAAERSFGDVPASVAHHAMAMRMVKTDEELALWSRAYRYFDDVHAYARDRIRERDPLLTDARLRLDMSGRVLDEIMADYGADRSVHGPVGITVDLGWVRAGRITGLPHPNQVRHAVIADQRTVQVSGIVQVGGCGGELYRPYLLAEPTAHERRLWTTARDGCLLLRDALRAGRTGGEVAQDVHGFQRANGVERYAATRPSHGQGMEGHQPPYIALGETTVLQPGMCFSAEPGLYDPAGGFGANFSDTFVVQAEGPAVQLSRLPWSEEWCWLG
ncbi:M24 family metallopeptidase [Streptomyces sp. MS2A]|nr:M24 family metallopeptidase [Streptomyces sp. MS2A]